MSENERLIAGRYRLGALVGRGGMAEVYEGVDTRLGRTVAVKLLKPDLADDPEFESKFRQEAQASARMAHPTIVRIYDAGEEETLDESGHPRKTPFIVMEFVRGRLLREVVQAGKVAPEEAIKYVSGVLTALEVSHRAGVVHRDIKPANVMIVEGDGVKVMDFGIARAISDNSATQAATAGIIGTAQYFSPEQARGESVDARTDLYSTGVLLYELLAGRPPFKGDTAVSVAYQHVSEAVTPPSAHNPAVAPELDAVVMRAMAKNKEDRFQSAEEFREHLLAAATASGNIALPVGLNQPNYFGSTDTTKTQIWRAPDPLETARTTTPTSLLDGFETAPNMTVASEPSKGGRGVLLGLGTGVGVVLVGLLIWVFTLGAGSPINTPSGIQVANVVGSTYDDAYNTLSAQNLLVLRVYEPSADVPEGSVVRQEPMAGTNVLANTQVTLYVSSGAEQVTVPNLIGLDETAYLAALTEAGLVVGLVTESESPSVPAGQVISSEPSVNMKIPAGTPVNIVVSNGKVTIPDVRNLDVLQARALLTAPTVGYTVSVEIQDAANCTGTPGTVVLDQSVPPGQAEQMQAIVLYVACVVEQQPGDQNNQNG